MPTHEMVIQCNPFVANPPIFEIVGEPSPNPPLVDAPARGIPLNLTPVQTAQQQIVSSVLKESLLVINKSATMTLTVANSVVKLTGL